MCYMIISKRLVTCIYELPTDTVFISMYIVHKHEQVMDKHVFFIMSILILKRFNVQHFNKITIYGIENWCFSLTQNIFLKICVSQT